MGLCVKKAHVIQYAHIKKAAPTWRGCGGGKGKVKMSPSSFYSSTKNPKILTSFGKIGGIVKGNTLHKNYKEKYVLRSPEPSLAVDFDMLHEAMKRGCQWVQYTDKDTGTTYKASVQQYLDANLSLDYGYGRQLRLPLRAFTITRKAGAIPVQQLNLWLGRAST